MPKVGMSAESEDPDKCSWISTEGRAPDSFTVDEAHRQKAEELRILGAVFSTQSTEDRLVEDGVSSAPSKTSTRHLPNANASSTCTTT